MTVSIHRFFVSALECPVVACPPNYKVQYKATRPHNPYSSASDLPPPRPRYSYQRYYKGGPGGGYTKTGFSKGGFSKGGFSKGGFGGENIIVYIAFLTRFNRQTSVNFWFFAFFYCTSEASCFNSVLTLNLRSMLRSYLSFMSVIYSLSYLNSCSVITSRFARPYIWRDSLLLH